MHNGKCLDLSFAATESEASAGIAQLSQRLSAQGLPTHKAGDVKIALAEAINNVIEHAYADITPAKVKVRCRLHQNWLEILISDTGNPLPGFRVPDGIPASLGSTIDELPEGGFGWFLIHELTSDIRYERSNGCNRLSLRFDFPKPS
ncbi:Serine-protein kinase RsbW [Ruegeria denitrificans]|uniref:Serine-protein kinase RsbW n=1 Tax=Ruegeria denitrificans TaxID=1715692 RepID=A0A0P1IWB9_9RHOB|nr:ATP-binding protein [Ruegeria denitrificans]CUK11602.1 Serine-protein kinase RsbW [Ruegeria denitrificans]